MQIISTKLLKFRYDKICLIIHHRSLSLHVVDSQKSYLLQLFKWAESVTVLLLHLDRLFYNLKQA